MSFFVNKLIHICFSLLVMFPLLRHSRHAHLSLLQDWIFSIQWHPRPLFLLLINQHSFLHLQVALHRQVTSFPYHSFPISAYFSAQSPPSHFPLPPSATAFSLLQLSRHNSSDRHMPVKYLDFQVDLPPSLAQSKEFPTLSNDLVKYRFSQVVSYEFSKNSC